MSKKNQVINLVFLFGLIAIVLSAGLITGDFSVTHNEGEWHLYETVITDEVNGQELPNRFVVKRYYLDTGKWFVLTDNLTPIKQEIVREHEGEVE